MSAKGSNPDFLLGGRTSASAECRHWSGRAVRSCAILLSCACARRRWRSREAIELQHDANVIRQHRDLDLAAQAAQAERHHSLPPGHGLTAVLALMEGDGVDDAEMYFTPFRPVAQLTLPLRHLRLRSSQKSRGPLPKQATLRPRG